MRRFGYLAAVIALAGSVGIGFSAGTGTAEPVTSETTLAFTGGAQSFVVPAGVDELRVEAFGGSGGDGGSCDLGTLFLCTGGRGGRAAHITSTVPVTPGETLIIVVGGRGSDGGSLIDVGTSPSCEREPPAGGAGGFGGGADGGTGGCPAAAGGGGGGATTILRSSTLLAVAAGGGGGSGGGFVFISLAALGINGAAGGDSGRGAPGSSICSGARGPGGAAGTATRGGTGGDGTFVACPQAPTDLAAGPGPFAEPETCRSTGQPGHDGLDGGAGTGGRGGDGGTDEQVTGGGGGGGGGGLFGGGGGAGGSALCDVASQSSANPGAGGGGGSSLAAAVVDGDRDGDGSLTISFTSPARSMVSPADVLAVTVAPRFTG